MMEPLSGLPDDVVAELTRFVDAAKSAWGGNLRSVVLYGSAAEGKLRQTSDVNVLVVLRAFDRTETGRIREALRFARAAIRLEIMILLESEIAEAAAAFGVKFGDICARHRILFGDDPFDLFEVDRDAALARLRQVLLNLRLRLRERYASLGMRAEQLVRVAADTTGPLRACAATLCRLEGSPAESPKAALERIVKELNDPRFMSVLATLTEVRAGALLEPQAADDLIYSMMELAAALLERTRGLA